MPETSNLPLQVPVCANDDAAIKVNVNAANILFIFRAISRKYRIILINDSKIILHLCPNTKDTWTIKF